MPNLNPNGLIFSTVTTFVEQVGRRRQWKYGDLDTLVCTFNGPAALAMQYKPKVNSPHPEYPLMFCTDSQITNQAALIAQIEATYQGIIQTTGASKYITPPVISCSAAEGTRDFTIFMMVGVYTGVIAVPQSGSAVLQTIYGTLYDIFTQTRTVHYVGNSVTIRYQAYPRPAPDHPNYSSLGTSLVKWQVISTFNGPSQLVASGVAPGTPYYNQLIQQYLVKVPPLFAAYGGMSLEQRGMWYNVTESYSPTF